VLLSQPQPDEKGVGVGILESRDLGAQELVEFGDLGLRVQGLGFRV